MKLTGTEHFSPKARRRRPARGVAEIELMLVIIVLLLPLLFLIGGAWSIGRARVRAAYDAENGAYAQVISGRNVTPNDLSPPQGLIDVRPGLPNRYDLQEIKGTVPVEYGSMGANRVSYSERAIFLDPTYHWSEFPYSPAGNADHAMIADWFAEYAAEVKTPEIVGSLGLYPPGPP